MIYFDSYTHGQDPIEVDHDMVREWTSVCHDKEFKKHGLWIRYDATRATSRWTYVERKRPFLVERAYGNQVASSKTLSGAIKLAREFLAEV